MKKSPLRSTLRADSALQRQVRDGISALARRDHEHLDVSIRARFEDSLEIDVNLREGRAREHRWDYLLGDGARERVVGLEPHGASDKEIKVVVAKKAAALEQLRLHLRDGQRIAAWFWVQSSRAGFLSTSRARRVINQEGITFVGRTLRAKDLDALPSGKHRRR